MGRVTFEETMIISVIGLLNENEKLLKELERRIRDEAK
jgi:hypothetical protein